MNEQAEAPGAADRYRVMFDDAPISLWDEDFSGVKAQVDALRASGITDFRAHCDRHPEVVRACAQKVRVVDVNKATLALYEATDKRDLLAGLDRTFTDESLEVFRDHLVDLVEGKPGAAREAVTRTLNGRLVHVIVRASVAPGCEETWKRVLVSITDVTERWRLEARLRRANRALRAMGRCAAVVARAHSEGGFLDEICEVIVREGGYRLAWVGLAEEGPGRRVRPVARAGQGKKYLDSLRVTWADDELGRGPTGTAIRTGQPSVAQQISSESCFGPWREAALRHEFRSSIALPVTVSGRTVGALSIYASEPHAFDEEEVSLLFSLVDDVAQGLAALRTRVDGERALKQAVVGAVMAMARAVEVRDPYTAGHQERVARLSRRIAQALDLDADRVEGIRMGAMIHDLGKIYLPAEILSKPGALNPAEQRLIQTHCEVGYEILSEIRFPWPVADIAHQHHEHLDGTGYPRGLRGDEICLEARIVAVADTVEAISSHRPYRPAVGLDAALEQIEAGRGTRFDPPSVDACLDLFRRRGFSL